MPQTQSSPGHERAMPQGRLFKFFVTFLSSINNILLFNIIFDVHDTYGVTVSRHMLLLNSFSFKFHS